MLKRSLIVCMSIAIVMSGCSSKKEADTEKTVSSTTATVTESVSTDDVKLINDSKNSDTTTKQPTNDGNDSHQTKDQQTSDELDNMQEVPQEEQPEETTASFMATVVSITPNLVVKTNELNPPESENIQLKADFITTDGEREGSRYELSNTYSMEELKPGDTVRVDSDYSLCDGKKVITESNYSNIDLVKGSHSYDFTTEKTIMDALEEVKKGSSNAASIHYNCHPGCFAKAYEGDSDKQQDLEALKELLNDYTVFELPIDPDAKEAKGDLDLYIKGTSKNEIKLVFTHQNLLIYTKEESDEYELTKKYEYYRSSIPSWNEVLHLFLTEKDLDQIAKSYIAYQKEVKDDNPYFKGENIVSYAMNQGYLIDLNNDGTKEKVFIGCADSPLSYTEYDQSYYVADSERAVIKMYINGTPCYRLDQIRTDATAFGVVDLNPKDKFQEIFLFNYGPSADYSYTFYHYQKNQMKDIGSAETYRMELEKQSNGTHQIKGMARLSNLQNWEGPATWKLAKDNTIQEVKVDLYYPTYDATLRYKIRGYEKMSITSKEVTINPQKVTFIATDNNEWVQMQLEDGKKVWMHLLGRFRVNPEDIIDKFDHEGDTIYPEEIFDGLCICG